GVVVDRSAEALPATEPVGGAAVEDRDILAVGLRTGEKHHRAALQRGAAELGPSIALALVARPLRGRQRAGVHRRCAAVIAPVIVAVAALVVVAVPALVVTAVATVVVAVALGPADAALLQGGDRAAEAEGVEVGDV